MLKRKEIYLKAKWIVKAKLFIRQFKEDIFRLSAKAEGVTTTWLVNKIFAFCQTYSEITFYPYQEQFSKRLIRSVLENDGAEISALFARQTGKSETVATTVGGMMIILPELANLPMFADDVRLKGFKKGLYVGIFAPSLRQAQTTFNRMKTRLSCNASCEVLAEFGLEFATANGQTVSLTNGSFVSSVSASDRSNIEGDSYMLIICEECQDISSFKIRKSISPMGASYNATMIKIGTATTFKGDFYETIQRNKKLWEEKKITLRRHFEYDYKVCQKYNPKYAKYIEKEMFALGEHSDEFRMSYGLEWILERGMFVDVNFLEKKCGLKNEKRYSSDLEATHVVGIDLAKRDDSTVITVVEVDWNNPVIQEEQQTNTLDTVTYTAYNTKIKDWKELTGDNYDSQYYEILDYIKYFKVKRIMIDATKEEGMADRLMINLPNVEVIPCIFSSSFKSDMYKHLESAIKTGRAKFPLHEEVQKSREYQKFIQQMGELEKEYRGQTLAVHHPNVRGAHDDYPDSWALAVYGAKDGVNATKVEAENTNKLYQNHYGATQFYNDRNNFTARRR